jgi:sugar/nucleoside kinase (ribokinase family)
MKENSIVGIGNALMDIVVQIPDELVLNNFDLPKGSMILIDSEKSKEINLATSQFKKVLAPGGSAANTIHGLSCLGAKTSFIGKVGDDELGRTYLNELQKIGSDPVLFKTKTPTGVAMSLVTPDSERTFGTYLGAAIELTPEELTPELFIGHNIAYIEGYLVQNHDLVRKAVQLASDQGLTIAIDLASYNVVEENLAFLKEIVSKYVDIVFANEQEALAFTGQAPREAVASIATLAKIAVVKTGEKGSLVMQGNNLWEIGIEGEICIDTTGAGDAYAAGFLYGFSENLPIPVCGKIASILASKVITLYGARIEDQLWDETIRDVRQIL